MEDLDEIVHEFLVESHENLDQLDSDLVALEGTPGSRPLLGSVFRTIHTIKGTSGFLAFHKLERLTHAGENLLVELRDGRRSMDLRTTDVLLRMVDTVRALLGAIEANSSEGDVDIDPVVAALQAVLEDRTPAADPVADAAAAATESAAADTAAAELAEAERAAVESAAAERAATEAAVDAAEVEAAAEAAAAEAELAVQAQATELVAEVSEALAAEPEAELVVAAAAPVRKRAVKAKVRVAAPVASSGAPIAPITGAPTTGGPPPAVPAGPSAPHSSAAPATPTGGTTQEQTVSARPAAPAGSTGTTATSAVPSPHHPAELGGPPADAPADPVPESTARTAADTSIRVDVDLLDALMRQVSELVLARNAISRLAQGGDIDLTRASQRLSLIASELQEGVMKTRMQPIEHVWSKVPRMVRDLAGACGRQVRLEMVGGDTELDRSLLEAVKDPLTHLIRNAIDHGIESPADRIALGKPAQGTLSLRAYHAGGQVVVEVTDDGKGIDPERVATKAVQAGVRTASQVAAMAPNDLLQLLFLPGFSTAEAVTNVSGRGVGMDVVRTKIEGIGGTVDIDSTIGRGTTWRLRIPLTLAIMPAVTVECAGATYAIPQVSLLELVALDAESASSSIEYVGAAPVYRLRGDLLPLVDLRSVFGSATRAESRSVIAVLQADTVRFGLLVDNVLNTEEIVVKPLSARLKAIGLFAGATLMGDGRVALILDVQGLARRSLSADTVDHARNARAADAAARAETVQVLVAGIGDGRRVAIPLSAVTRLERFPSSVVEHVGSREVMQYRGAITPVVRLDRVLGSLSEMADEIVVVVYSRGERSVAIVVDEIVDIVDDEASHHSALGDHGLVGSTVLKERVTELLDVRAAVALADPTFFDDETVAAVLGDLVGV